MYEEIVILKKNVFIVMSISKWTVEPAPLVHMQLVHSRIVQ